MEDSASALHSFWFCVYSLHKVGSARLVCPAMGSVKEVLIVMLVCHVRALSARMSPWLGYESGPCLSWRLGVETNNIRFWRTVPSDCLRYMQNYMLEGQYEHDLNMVVYQITSYMLTIDQVGDGFDSWIFDVDDTCISNLEYYRRSRRFGVDPFDPLDFKSWAVGGCSPAIPAVLELFQHLTDSGFKVFLITGRDIDSLGKATEQNLVSQGFIGYERLILRGPEYRGQSAIVFKSAARRALVEEGYRIWGNVGDQWSDLVGDCLGERTFKLPNPMYFVP
ncbi:acid phosphatase 1 [Nymphaea colorata]|nr:acid phosphatase 1 [Nymphaea colorata]